MFEFIKGLGSDPEELTPLEIAEELTGVTMEELRHCKAYVVVPMPEVDCDAEKGGRDV